MKRTSIESLVPEPAAQLAAAQPEPDYPPPPAGLWWSAAGASAMPVTAAAGDTVGRGSNPAESLRPDKMNG